MVTCYLSTLDVTFISTKMFHGMIITNRLQAYQLKIILEKSTVNNLLSGWYLVIFLFYPIQVLGKIAMCTSHISRHDYFVLEILVYKNR